MSISSNFLFPLVSSSKTKPCQFSWVQFSQSALYASLQVYAQNTFNEVLGWYGLQCSSTSSTATSSSLVTTSSASSSNAVAAHTAQVINTSSSTSAAAPGLSTIYRCSDAGALEDSQQLSSADHPLDLTCSAATASSLYFSCGELLSL